MGFSHNRWITRIGEYTGEDDALNIIRFSLSYTLQSLRYGEDLNRFKWED